MVRKDLKILKQLKEMQFDALMDVEGGWVSLDGTESNQVYKNVEELKTLNYSHSNYKFVVIKYFGDESDYFYRINQHDLEVTQ